MFFLNLTYELANVSLKEKFVRIMLKYFSYRKNLEGHVEIWNHIGPKLEKEQILKNLLIKNTLKFLYLRHISPRNLQKRQNLSRIRLESMRTQWRNIFKFLKSLLTATDTKLLN